MIFIPYLARFISSTRWKIQAQLKLVPFKCCVYGLEMFLEVYELETSLQPPQLKQHQFSFLLGLDVSLID